MQDLLSLGKALSDPTRIRVLNLLLRSTACVCELEDALEIGQSTLSSHLQTLRTAGLVESERQRTWVTYRLAPGAEQTLAVLFGREPRTDKRLLRDVSRFEERLAMRQDGCCVLPAGQLNRELTGTRP